MRIKFVKNISKALIAVMIVYMLVSVLKLPEAFLWIYKVAILFIFFSHWNNIRIKENSNKSDIYLISIFIIWLLFQFIRGSVNAEDYWVWKNVFIQLLITLFYVVIIISTNTEIIKKFYNLYWLFFLPMLVVSLLYNRTKLLLDYVPYATLLLFFGLIPKKNKWILLGIVAFFFLYLEQRNDLIKIIVLAFIGITISYGYFWIPKWGLKLVHITLLSLPLVLMYLGVTGNFNVFKMDEYIQGDFKQEVKSEEGIVEENLKADTRTFIYENVFATLNKYDAWIFGRSPAFGDEGLDEFWGTDEDTGLVGRYGNEVGIMDILLWYGLVGVLIYFMIFIRSSYLAIYKSNSKYAKAVGLYVAFLWVWAFIWEKPAFETYFMMDLVLIGLCFSKQFREMTDNDMEIWVKGIFT